MRSILDLILLLLGVAAFASAGGFLVGASNSPVVGAFLTAVFGLMAGGLGTLASMKGSAQGRGGIRNVGSIVGGLLLTFSLFLIVGVVKGAEVRASGWPNSKPVTQVKKFPWNPERVPKDALSALDWIAVQEQLILLGYSEDQVNRLYANVETPSKQSGVLFNQPPLLSSVLNSFFHAEPPSAPSGNGIADSGKRNPLTKEKGEA